MGILDWWIMKQSDIMKLPAQRQYFENSKLKFIIHITKTKPDQRFTNTFQLQDFPIVAVRNTACTKLLTNEFVFGYGPFCTTMVIY